MINDQDILEENRQVLRRRYRLLARTASVDVSRLGLSPEAAHELRALDPMQVDRAADAVSPLFAFDMEEQILHLLANPQPVHLAHPSNVETELQEDAALLLVNRWSSSRQCPSFAATVLGLSKQMITGLSRATYSDVRRVACQGIQARLCVRPQYIFHAGRNIMLQTSQRTSLAVCNTRFNSF